MENAQTNGNSMNDNSLSNDLTNTSTDVQPDDSSVTQATADDAGTAEAGVSEVSSDASSNGTAVSNGSAVIASAAETDDTPAEAQAPDESQAAVEAQPAVEPQAAAPSRPEGTRSRQPSMAQVMESDEFSSYMSGVDALTRGALLKGVVVRVDEGTGEVLVDIGTKSEGIISRNEIGDDEVNVGDEIEVVVLRSEDDEGHPVLSKRRADYERTWREIIEAKEKGTFIEGTVREQVKGGLIVDLGVPAFVPASHVDARNRGDLGRFIGRTIPVRVIETDRKKNKVIASHRLAAEEERKHREEKAWANLQKDKIVEGTVRRITDFGAFIDLGGVDGLLHVREMAWGRVENPETIVKKGQKLQVLILDIDEERKRIALGLKQLLSDPWKKAAKNYHPGQTVTGKVVRIAPTCAFMELEEGVEGIIPISEMSDQRIKTPDEILQVGQQVEARVKQIQANQRRITLSLKGAAQERERRETRSTLREINERAGGDDSVRLGDVFGQQLRAARDRGRERNAARTADRSAARERALQAAAEEEDDVVEEGEDWVEENGAADEVVTITNTADAGVDEAVADEAPADEAASVTESTVEEPAVEEQQPATAQE